MLSLFSVPKPFEGNYKIIQENAIQSWLLLDPVPEIILCGNESGISETCNKYGLMQISDIQRNQYGTPLLNDIFEKVTNSANNDVICYINTDIILFPEFAQSLKELLSVQKSGFLLTGNRWNLDLNRKVDFGNGWVEILRKEISIKGKLNRPGIDYFVFHKTLYKRIPPFAIGRFSWDMWLAFEAQSLGFKVIDTTGIMIAIHQNHDYPFLGLTGSYSKRNRLFLELHPEVQQNQKLCGARILLPTYRWYDFNGKKVRISVKAIILNNYYTLRRILSWSMQRLLLKFIPRKA